MSAAGSGTAVAKSLKRQATTKKIYGVVPASELEKPFDLVVIGGGPAGVAAAEKAAFLGRRAIIVDDSACAPTELDLAFGAPTGLFSKALRDTAKTVDVDSVVVEAGHACASFEETTLDVYEMHGDDVEYTVTAASGPPYEQVVTECLILRPRAVCR